MKMTRRLFPLILLVCPSINWVPQVAAQADRKACWIVDVTNTRTGEVDYVDGVRVPNDIGTVNFLRQQERKTSPRTCMLGFVTSSAHIEDVDTLRKIAGKIEYQESRVYLYGEQDRGFATEILWTPQVSAQAAGKGARTVDVAITKTGEADYVDGARVPANMTTVDFLRQLQKTDPRTSLVVFVTASARIQDVENLRRIAEKMQYQDFHPYVRDRRDPESVVEVLYGPRVSLDELRSGPNGPVPLPESQPAKK